MNAWERLQLHLQDAMGEEGFAVSVGVHLGLAIALRHPEWAAAMNHIINEDGMERGPGSKPTSEVVDVVVRDVPLEVYDGE